MECGHVLVKAVPNFQILQILRCQRITVLKFDLDSALVESLHVKYNLGQSEWHRNSSVNIHNILLRWAYRTTELDGLSELVLADGAAVVVALQVLARRYATVRLPKHTHTSNFA